MASTPPRTEALGRTTASTRRNRVAQAAASTTLARALLVGEVFGTQRDGQVNGGVALLVALGLAAAPWLAGVGHSLIGDYRVVLASFLIAWVIAAGWIRHGHHPR